MNVAVALKMPTTFVIDNNIGTIVVSEGQGTSVQIVAQQDGNDPVTVSYDEVSPGKFKIHVEYPEVAGISIGRGGGVNISSISTGGSVEIINGVVKINGRVVNGNSPGADVQPLKLNITIPSALLASLKVNSVSGDVVVRGGLPRPWRSRPDFIARNDQWRCALRRALLTSSNEDQFDLGRRYLPGYEAGIVLI